MSGSDHWTSARIGQDLSDADDSGGIEESPSYWWVPFVDDPEVLRGMLIIKESYSRELMAEELGADVEDAPRRAEETRLFRQMFRTSAGMSIDQALRSSDLDRQNAMVGLDSSSDAGGTSKLIELVGRIEEGYIAYQFGSMGSGKTDFAILLAELWSKMQGDEHRIGSNIESFERAEHVCRYPVLRDWVREGDEPTLFVWDEASSSASGYSSEAHEVMDKFRLLLQSFRKNRCNLLIIGHTGKDVHPHIRRQANDCIHKESKERATVYDEVVEGEGEGEKFSISGIEPTSLRFDTKEMSRWYWET